MAAPVVVVESGGLPVVEDENGLPVTPSVAAGDVKAFGAPVTIVTDHGAPVQFIGVDGTPWPGGVEPE